MPPRGSTSAWPRPGRRGPARSRNTASRPWATVLRAATDGGDVWLKAPGAGHRVRGAAVRAARRRSCPTGSSCRSAWTASAAGCCCPTAASRSASTCEVDDLAEALAAYAQLQRDLAPHAGRMLELGLADMRPQVMPAAIRRGRGGGRRPRPGRGHARRPTASGASAWPPRRSRRQHRPQRPPPLEHPRRSARSTTGATRWSPTPSPACSAGWGSRPSPRTRCPACATRTSRASPSTAPTRTWSPSSSWPAGWPRSRGR